MSLHKNRGTFWAIGVATALIVGWTAYTPIPFTYLKWASLLGLLLLVSGISLGFKHGKWFGLSVVLGLLIVTLWAAQPSRAPDLQSSFVTSLLAYRETPYVWGGENGRGIDCSGLIRRAMINALLAQGWKTHDPSLWREAAFIWWNDCSANEMKNGYSGRIQPIFETRSLNSLNESQLKTGDIAVLKSGVHVLAYVGKGTWIQADPNLANGGGKVIETSVPSRNGWFGQRVIMCRWEILR
jgi:hypothetical protein